MPRRSDTLLALFIMAVLLAAAYRLSTLHSNPLRVDQVVVIDNNAPVVEAGSEVNVKVRFMVYRNGVLVVNKTDPPNYNFYQLARFALGWKWFNGTVPYLRLLATNGNFYEGRVLVGTSYYFGVTDRKVLVGSGYHTWSIYVANVSEPVKTADVVAYKLDGNRLLLLATFLFNETAYVQEVGWYVKIYETYYGSYVYGPVEVMLLYETFNGFYVEPGDNVTVLWVLEFPTSQFADAMLKWFWGGYNLDFDATAARVTFYINTTSGENTETIGCINQLYTNTEPPKIVLVCAGFSDYDGNITRICVNPGWLWSCTVDIRPTEIIPVKANDPLTFVLTLTTR